MGLFERPGDRDQGRLVQNKIRPLAGFTASLDVPDIPFMKRNSDLL